MAANVTTPCGVVMLPKASIGAKGTAKTRPAARWPTANPLALRERLLLGGLVFAIVPPTLPESWPISTTHLRLIGVVLTAIALGYLAAVARV